MYISVFSLFMASRHQMHIFEFNFFMSFKHRIHFCLTCRFGYSIQQYVIQVVSDLRHLGGYLLVFQITPSIKLPKGYPEAVNRRRTDYMMAKSKKKRTSDQQNITHKTKDRVTRTLLKTGGELICPDYTFNKTYHRDIVEIF
jgi:hypothetical protein